MDKQQAIDNLKDVTSVLTNLGVRNFLIDGTLLGLIRDEDFIGFDTDTDLGVMFEDFKDGTLQSLIMTLENMGLKLKHKFGDWKNNFELSFERNDVKTDLFFYRKQKDKIVFHAFNGNDIITYWYEPELILNLKEAVFLGEKFMIPSEPVKILRAKYGENWRVPDYHWDWAYSPRNIVDKKPTIFTIGCFDTLHEGHINLFNKMKEEIGEPYYNNPFMWVFIHDDLSIFKNKGRFPVQTLEHRVLNLKRIGIEKIIEISSADPTKEIKDFLDYHNGNKFIYMRADDWKKFPGKGELDRRGVEIKYIPYTQGVSSTEIRNNIKLNG